ncbi:MAG TPA: peptidylprolyl isomerase [Deltaproteobacteria bacterium]|nr:MAG: peptidylprolyl isomerase [Deltaproteobacteria bacterium]HDM75519.1 peptidylprolyl isomerase [Deltaproteobacteria bacterium]
MEKVKSGHFVKVHYTGKLESGEVFDSSRNAQPIEIKVGAGQVIKGFEDALIGMAVNETKTFTLSPEEAYGERDENLEQTFMKSSLPPNFEPKVGEILGLQTPEGHQIPATVKDVDSEKIVVDLNHPLAGKSLTFEIEVMEINECASASMCGGCSCSC